MLFTDGDNIGPLNTYSLSIESAKLIGTDSIYYNFFSLNSDWFESDTCEFWGSSDCIKQNAPAWTGTKMKYDNIETYHFYNLYNDSLTFSFNTEIDGPLQFYRDSIQQFNMMFVGTDTLTILGQLDTARFFSIQHSDLDGNTIDSPLNGHQIVISKLFGLVQFFIVESFPEVLKPLFLIGSESPTAGLRRLTNEMLYDYQPGDELQYRETSWYQPPAPPWYYYTRYRKWVFLERNETVDSLNYIIRQELFYEDSVGIEIDTIAKIYLRSESIAEIPFEKYDGSTKTLRFVEYCDKSRWTYTRNYTEGPVFCDADTCWGSGDTNGPPESWYSSYVVGLGLSSSRYSQSFEYGFDIQKNLIYHQINGEACGGQIYVGIDNFVKRKDKIIIQPNPASHQVQISADADIHQMVVKDLSGHTQLSQSNFSNTTTIDISRLSNGLYFVSILLENGQRQTSKLVVLKK